MRFYIHTVEELVELIENLAQEARSKIGTTRTVLESNELKGQVYAYNETLFYIKEMVKTQKEDASGTGKVESVANGSSSGVPSTDDAGSAQASKMKPV